MFTALQKMPFSSTISIENTHFRCRGRMGGYECQSPRKSYCDPLDSTCCMSHEISLPCFEGRHPEAVSYIAHANLRCRGHSHSQRGDQQRPRPHAHRISTLEISQRHCETAQGTYIAYLAARVSRSAQTLLGQTLLGNRLWRMEFGQYHR